jgi:glycine hydroxymethyltransferase
LLLGCWEYNGVMNLSQLVRLEEKRQSESLQLIPSENYVSKRVRNALATVLSNKYSEGYPGKRYYQGNSYIDDIEEQAISLAKDLFKVPHANVQPYSGSPANAAAIMAVCEPGEKIMGLKLSGGGHLTHGHPDITFSGKFFKSIQFDVNQKGLIDYDKLEKLVKAEKPKLIIAGTTAYPRILDFERFGQIAEKYGAYLLADISHISGLVIGRSHPSPVPYAHIVMTTTHKTLRGPRGAILMVTQKGLDRDSDLAKKVDRAVFPGLQGGPHNHTTLAIALALEEATTPDFKYYARQVVQNAQVLSSELIKLGYKITTGGTDNHLMVMDLRTTKYSGKQAAEVLEEAGIVTNYNTIPHDPNPPFNPSGIRLGTPAITTRGMKEDEMILIAGWINQVLKSKPEDFTSHQKVLLQIKQLCSKFPIT